MMTNKETSIYNIKKIAHNMSSYNLVKRWEIEKIITV